MTMSWPWLAAIWLAGYIVGMILLWWAFKP
jgi:hypothetical protein